MKKIILRLGLLLSCLSVLTANAAIGSTKNSILQTQVAPFLLAEDTSDQLQSVEDLLARAVNPDPSALPMIINTIPLWADVDGLLLKDSGVSIDGSNNMSGVNDINAGGTITAATGVTVSAFGAGVVHSSAAGVLSSSQVVDADIVNNTISGLKITDLTITNAKLADATITNEKLLTVGSIGTPGDLVALDAAGSFTASGDITATNFYGNLAGNAATATSAVTSTSATYFTGSLSGDVIGTQDATVVVNVPAAATVATKTALAVALATGMVESATSANIPGTLVKRNDLTGDFTANRMFLVESAITGANQVPTKSYVDTAAATGIRPHDPARTYTAGAINIVTGGLLTIDGVLLVDNNRVLVNKTVGGVVIPEINNGLWLAHVGAWTRPADFDDVPAEESNGTYVLISEGIMWGGSSWLITGTALIGTDPIAFAQFSMPGETTGANVGAGAGLIFRDKTGTPVEYINMRTIAAATVPAAATASHITVATVGDTVTVATDGTNLNTASAIVARDGSGNFAAGTISANLTGNVTGEAILSNGTVGTPSLRFASDIDTGIFHAATDDNTLRFATNGIERMTVNNMGVTVAAAMSLRATLTLNASTAGAPSLSFAGDPNTGIFNPGTNDNTLHFTADGVERMSMSTANLVSTLPLTVPVGSTGTPSINFSGDTNTGIYRPTTADTMGFVGNGVEVMRTSSFGINIYYPLDAARISNLTSSTDGSINYITLTADNLKYPLINITMTTGGPTQDLYLENLPVTGIPTGQVNLITVDRTGTAATIYGSQALIVRTSVDMQGLKRFADGIGYRFMSAMLIFNGTSWYVG